MEGSHRYVMLIASLPYHGPLFGARQTPLSRIRLGQRLQLLDADDAQTLRSVSSLLDWAHHDVEHSDAELLARARRLVPEFTSGFVRELVTWRLEIRTLVAALRRRQRGVEAPGSQLDWGYGRWLGHIQRHWGEPHFRLERVFPWLPEATRLFASDDSFGFERLILGIVWDYLEHVSDGHYFDFEAVLVYTLRWDLIARWTGYNGKDAVARFDELVSGGLESFDETQLAAG